MQAKCWWLYLGYRANRQCTRISHNTLPPYATSRSLRETIPSHAGPLNGPLNGTSKIMESFFLKCGADHPLWHHWLAQPRVIVSSEGRQRHPHQPRDANQHDWDFPFVTDRIDRMCSVRILSADTPQRPRRSCSFAFLTEASFGRRVVLLSVCQSRVYSCDNSSPVQSRTTKMCVCVCFYDVWLVHQRKYNSIRVNTKSSLTQSSFFQKRVVLLFKAW